MRSRQLSASPALDSRTTSHRPHGFGGFSGKSLGVTLTKYKEACLNSVKQAYGNPESGQKVQYPLMRVYTLNHIRDPRSN